MAGFALRALGMVFRVFVAARLGPEGMGLYQLILSVYMVFVSLASAGINVASTRLGAQCLTRGRGMAPTLRSLAATAAVLGTAAMLAQLALADPLARFALHDSRAELGLCTLAPSLPFIAAAGALRGCFLARRRVEPNIIAQLVEQTVRMAVAALALVKLAHWGAAYACCAVLIGNTVSEAVSCGIMALFARQEPSFRPCADDPPRGYTSRELWEIVLPVTGSRLVASVLQAGESVLIPACLAAYLGTRAEAVAQYGSLKGMALPLIFFPFSVLAALSGLLMPEITRAHTARDTVALRRLVRLAMGLTGGFSLLVGGRAGAVWQGCRHFALSRCPGGPLCAGTGLCGALYVPGKHGGCDLKRHGGAAGDLPLFGAGFHFAHCRHFVADAAIRYAGFSGGHDSL